MDGHADTRHTPVLSIRTREPEKVRICHDTTADLEPPDQCLMSQNGGGTQTPDTRPSYLSGHKSQRKSGYATTRQLSSNQCLMSQNGGGMLHWTPTCFYALRIPNSGVHAKPGKISRVIKELETPVPRESKATMNTQDTPDCLI
ncbi:hypothetical protein RRG08_053220 [Elysia crispata]|uniref:Uncharacterized protein n=1 Tax=Elysia crispata TaxID=231223 RepID=A0AAE1EA80_9GAST|nr:hypothetical protein RRG08_053220 [Elysia crispata]